MDGFKLYYFLLLFYFNLPTSYSTSAILEYFLDGSFSKTLSTSVAVVYSPFFLLSKLCRANCTRAAFDFGKSIPDNIFAMVAAEIDGDATAALPP